MILTTTLNAIWAHQPCEGGWEQLLTYLGKTTADDEILTFATILTSNGLDDALWALRTVTGHDGAIRQYAVWCARQVQHLMTDPRSLAALEVAERHANGLATDEELAAARSEAWDAAGDAAWDAAQAAAQAAARAAERAAARAAEGAATLSATASSARSAAWDAARKAQVVEFQRRFCTEDGA